MKPIGRAAKLSACPAIAACVWFACSPPAFATVLQESSSGQECRDDVPACDSVDSQLIVAKPNDQRTIRLICPASAPYFWNWSADVSSHVEVQLVQSVLNEDRDEIGAWFFFLQQSTAAPGALRIHLGCSSQTPSADHPFTFRYRGFGWNPHQPAE